jgi:hypothetical protein
MGVSFVHTQVNASYYIDRSRKSKIGQQTNHKIIGLSHALECRNGGSKLLLSCFIVITFDLPHHFI